MKTNSNFAAFRLLTIMLFFTFIEIRLMSTITTSRKAFMSDELSKIHIPNNEFETSVFGRLFGGAGMDIEQCKPGSPDFMKFLATTRAIITSEDQVVEAKGFCFDS